MRRIGIVIALVLSTVAFVSCGNSQSESNGVPTQMGTDADSTDTPYMDTTATSDSISDFAR